MRRYLQVAIDVHDDGQRCGDCYAREWPTGVNRRTWAWCWLPMLQGRCGPGASDVLVVGEDEVPMRSSRCLAIDDEPMADTLRAPGYEPEPEEV